LDMVMLADFDTLEKVIILYRNDPYGMDLVSFWKDNPDGQQLSYNYTLVPYPPTGADFPTVLSTVADNVENNTAILVLAFDEIQAILTAAQAFAKLETVPWYSASLSFNQGIVGDPMNYDFAKKVNFKTVEFRGTNIQDQTLLRTVFFQNMTAIAQRPLPSYVSFIPDAALMILNTPGAFNSNASEVSNGMKIQSTQLFGLSGWLTLDKQGFRDNGDLVIELVIATDNFRDNWVELGYIESSVHTVESYNFYSLTSRQLGNYLIPGNWAENCTAASPYADILARDISRQYQEHNISFTPGQVIDDISIPLYDTLFISYEGCDGATRLISYCPSALFGSDTQCDVQIDYLSSAKRQTPAAIKKAALCSVSGSDKGCTNTKGAPQQKCAPSKNVTCAASAFTQACAADPKHYSCAR